MGKTVLPVLEEARRRYHQRLLRDVWGYRSGKKEEGDNTIPTNADSSSPTSRAIAARLAELVASNAGVNLKTLATSGQALGQRFTDHTREFLEETFLKLGHARPGPWRFATGQSDTKISRYEPYVHLSRLELLLGRLAKEDPQLWAGFTEDYLVTPDIIIAREPWPDERLNQQGLVIIEGDRHARYAPFRKRKEDQPLILHASVSCKWTLRSDRGQNSRTEALNLIRNRKGRLPHIVVVLAEPMPTRIASVALGTGDIDCVYHVALPELQQATRDAGKEDQAEVLEELVQGARLRDITDLPLDLAV